MHDFSEDPRAFGAESPSSNSTTILIVIVAVSLVMMLVCGGVILGGVYMVRTAQQQAQVALEQARSVQAAQSQSYAEFAGLSGQGRYAEALQALDRALADAPDNHFLLNNKAWLLATCPVAECRDGKQAIEVATRACELTNWVHAAYLDTLAAAYAEAGDFSNAVQWQEEAIRYLNGPGFGDPQGFHARLELFQAEKPYREGVVPAGYTEPSQAESSHTEPTEPHMADSPASPGETPAADGASPP